MGVYAVFSAFGETILEAAHWAVRGSVGKRRRGVVFLSVVRDEGVSIEIDNVRMVEMMVHVDPLLSMLGFLRWHLHHLIVISRLVRIRVEGLLPGGLPRFYEVVFIVVLLARHRRKFVVPSLTAVALLEELVVGQVLI